MNQSALGYSQGKEIFKDYVLKGFLGEGGFGRVYHVANGFGRPFALKVLHRGLDMEQQGIEAVRGVMSVRLVELLDFGRTVRDEPCLLMEYCKESLSQVMARQVGLPEEQACAYFTEILKGLKVLEDNGIVHRDIKPANLFIKEDVVKIGDFGMSRFTSGESHGMTTGLGTIAYSAPESFDEDYGFSVDRWSAAVVFYEMLTGRPAFDGASNKAVFKQVMVGNPDLSLVLEKYRFFLETCFNKKSSERYGDIQAMTVAFAEACSGPAAATESPLKGKGEPVSAQTSKDDRGIERDGHYVRYENGVVYDEKTGLEWVAGPDWGTNWDEAKKWVSSLNVPGGGWRMPKRDELRTLYQKGAGERNMTPLLQTTGWSVWSGEIKDSSSAWYFNLRNGLENWICRDISLCDRGFAVRSRR